MTDPPNLPEFDPDEALADLLDDFGEPEIDEFGDEIDELLAKLEETQRRWETRRAAEVLAERFGDGEPAADVAREIIEGGEPDPDRLRLLAGAYLELLGADESARERTPSHRAANGSETEG